MLFNGRHQVLNQNITIQSQHYITALFLKVTQVNLYHQRSSLLPNNRSERSEENVELTQHSGDPEKIRPECGIDFEVSFEIRKVPLTLNKTRCRLAILSAASQHRSALKTNGMCHSK